MATSQDRPLRVLHVISSMGWETGGPAAVCAGLAGALAARGHEVAVATIEAPGHSPMVMDPRVKLHAFALAGSMRYARSEPLDKWVRGHIGDFDIAHLHGVWQYPTFAAARACRRHAVPYVTLPHGMLDRYSLRQRSYLLKAAYWRLQEGRIHRGAAALHLLNRAEIRNAMPWIAALPKFVLGNGIAESELAALPPRGQFRAAHQEIGQRPLALFLSRIHPKKGLDRLIPAWKNLAAGNPEARLAIAGAGDADYVAGIDRLIGQHHLEKHVLRVGQLTGQAKWQALVDADIVVLPSHQEGFSMAITEALAAARPVVATRECNFDELGEEQCGILIENGDMAAFVAAVDRLFSDDRERAAMGARAVALVKRRFTWEGIAQDLEAVYRWILAGRALPADGRDVWRPNDTVAR